MVRLNLTEERIIKMFLGIKEEQLILSIQRYLHKMIKVKDQVGITQVKLEISVVIMAIPLIKAQFKVKKILKKN